MKKTKDSQENFIFFNNEEFSDYPKNFFQGNYKVLKNLKDNERSLVNLIEIKGKKIVYKEPKEKNIRKWQRFLSLFRGGESHREFLNNERIIQNGFKSAAPLVAYEMKKCGMTVDSFIMMEYLEARHAEERDAQLVVRELKKIHDKGYLHGDSQLSNFMIFNGEVFIIDCKFSRNSLGIIGKIWEFMRLEKGCSIPIKSGYEESFLYKLIKWLDRKTDTFNYWRKGIRRKIKGEKI